jgi:hypothetical protein
LSFDLLKLLELTFYGFFLLSLLTGPLLFKLQLLELHLF